MVLAEVEVAIRGEDGIIEARQRARDMARSLGFGAVDQSRIATAVSELARNVVRYATDGCGTAVVRPWQSGEQRGIEVVVLDEGPGIADVEQVMERGFTSGGGLGLGLPGTRRLMDEMTIDSGAGRGTRVTVRKHLR